MIHRTQEILWDNEYVPENKEGVRSHVLRVTYGIDPPSGYWESNLGLLEEEPAVYASQPSFQLHYQYFYRFFYLCKWVLLSVCAPEGPLACMKHKF